jgi:hemerythrin-like metal-binding protein
MDCGWKDQYVVGHPDIDSQHKALFDSVDLLISTSSRSGQLLCAKALYDETRDHFAFEEQLMAGVDYPEVDKHKDHHRHLLSKIDTLAHQIADRSFNTMNLQRFVTEWLVNHIVTSDADLAKHLQMSGQEQAQSLSTWQLR